MDGVDPTFTEFDRNGAPQPQKGKVGLEDLLWRMVVN